LSGATGERWTARETPFPNGRGLHCSVSTADAPLHWSDALALLASDGAFRTFLTRQLVAAPFDAYRWETPALTTATMDRPFEYVLIGDPSLMRRPDPKAFASCFGEDRTGAPVAAIPNLTRTSTLIVPRRLDDEDAYPHLAAFVRRAPASQIDALWRCVADSVRTQLSPRPLWLSTAGAGVAWLHVRIDPTPKYYRHRHLSTTVSA